MKLHLHFLLIFDFFFCNEKNLLHPIFVYRTHMNIVYLEDVLTEQSAQ